MRIGVTVLIAGGAAFALATILLVVGFVASWLWAVYLSIGCTVLSALLVVAGLVLIILSAAGVPIGRSRTR